MLLTLCLQRMDTVPHHHICPLVEASAPPLEGAAALNLQAVSTEEEEPTRLGKFILAVRVTKLKCLESSKVSVSGWALMTVPSLKYFVSNNQINLVASQQSWMQHSICWLVHSSGPVHVHLKIYISTWVPVVWMCTLEKLHTVFVNAVVHLHIKVLCHSSCSR